MESPIAPRCLHVALLAAMVAASGGCVPRGESARRSGTATPSVVDLDGKPAHPLQDEGARAIVLVFVKTDCPISNRYAPEIRRLHEKYAARGVVFWLVYSDPDESAKEIRDHVRDYDYDMGVLLDPRHALVERTGVRVTPEAAVFAPRRSGAALRYRGRIDDRYVDFGRMRSAATVNDLDRALEAILEGRRVPRKRTEAVGCFIGDRP